MLAELLTLGSRWTLVGGKGGVGKTTTAAALAVELASSRTGPVLVLSVDPAHSLGDALGMQLGPEPSAVPGVPGLEALEVDAAHERARFLEEYRTDLVELIERGTYLDAADARGMVGLAVPGMDEIAALLRLLRLAAEPDLRVVIDTAPTGHTLRLLELPTLARGWLAALEAMEERDEAVARALVGRPRHDRVTTMLDRLRDDLARLDELLADAGRTRFVLVSTPEPVVLAETRRYREALEEMGIALAGIVVNRARPDVDPAALGKGMLFVPPLESEPEGVEGLRSFAAATGGSPPSARPSGHGGGGLRIGEPFAPPPDRVLYLVGGKGGVGKSTVAGALAIQLADRRPAPVLLLGTDPAGSLGDVLGVEVGAEPVAVPGVTGLRAQELDAAGSWAAFREEFRDDVERLFAGLLGGLSAEADLRVVQRLVDLAPPGIDELMALLEVVERLEDGSGGPLVVDTAPTGHLLRLLEMPSLALEWVHTLMRLLLKYREVVRLGELADRLLRLSRSLHRLQALMQDPERCWTLLVALPEALSVPETERLQARLREMEIPVGALLVNRLLDADGSARASPSAARLLTAAPGLITAAAPALARGPVGAPALREMLGGWRVITTESTS